MHASILSVYCQYIPKYFPVHASIFQDIVSISLVYIFSISQDIFYVIVSILLVSYFYFSAVSNKSMRLFVIGHCKKGKTTVLKTLRGDKFLKESHQQAEKRRGL